MRSIVLAALVLCSCWHLMEVPLYVYQKEHPPPVCDSGVPGDGRAYDCVADSDGGFGGGPGHWVCADGSLCDGGAR